MFQKGGEWVVRMLTVRYQELIGGWKGKKGNGRNYCLAMVVQLEVGQNPDEETSRSSYSPRNSPVYHGVLQLLWF